MKFITVLLLAVISANCAIAGSSITGSYIYYGGGTQSITLNLLPSGDYNAHWSLDIYPNNGDAVGKWSRKDDQVILTPRKETGELKGYLTILLVRPFDQRPALLRKEDLKYDKNRFFYFYLESSNKP